MVLNRDGPHTPATVEFSRTVAAGPLQVSESDCPHQLSSISHAIDVPKSLHFFRGTRNAEWWS